MTILPLTLAAGLSVVLHIHTTAAHMLLQHPARFPSQLTTNTWNGPLNTTLSGYGSDYPCKLGDMPDTYGLCGTDGSGQHTCIERTPMMAGSNFTMSFIGESVHGGGSCQISLTKDLEPTKESVFKVIHSIIGGCPARNTPGNIGDDNNYTAPDADTYTFLVPEDLDEGNYTFSWTWFNKIGRREMYQNCAPITISKPGSSSLSSTAASMLANSSSSTYNKRDTSFFDDLPRMFLANIPDVADCASPASGQNMVFPDPGDSVEHNNAGDVFSPPIVSNNANCYAPVELKMAASSSAGESASTTASAGSIAPATSTVLSGQSSTATSSSNTEAASAAFTNATSTIEVIPTPATPEVTSPIAATSSVAPPISSATTASASTFPGAGSACSGTSVSCTTPGALICVSMTEFGLCDINYCAIPRAVAAGTVCQSGAIVKRDAGEELSKRDVLVGSNGRGGLVLRERRRKAWRG